MPENKLIFPIFTVHAKNLPELKRSFSQSLFLITAIAFLGTVIYQLFPNPAYSPAAAWLPGLALFILALFIFFFTLFNLFSQLLLTINKRYAAACSLSTALLQSIRHFYAKN